MGTIKYRNSKDLTEAEEIKKQWPEYTEELFKGLNDLDNHCVGSSSSSSHTPRTRHPGM